MRNRVRWAGLSLLAVGMLAGQEPKPLTAISMFKVKVDKAAPWLETMKKVYEPVMKNLLSDGAVLAYGIDFEVLHRAGRTNAAAWFDAPNFAAYGKAIAAIDEAQENHAADFQRLLEWQDIEAHEDLLLQTIDANFKPVKSGARPYAMLSVFKVREGLDQEFMDGFKKVVKPGWDRLVADGAINGYSVMKEAVHSSDMGHTWFAISMNDLSGMDKIVAADEEAMKSRSPEDQRMMTEGLRKVADLSAHRDWLLQSAVFAMKE
ncbi:MAG: hypothetical protein KIT09_06560 [Bryobacteraceae bacterium]|nr:hypothetical protein [Bryobacteraceae bacterium]